MITYSDLRWSKYVLPSGRSVFLTQRPDRATPQSVSRFEFTHVPIIRFSFCDDYVEPSHKTPWHWLPWVTGKNIPLENVFAFISMMKRYDEEHVRHNSIWLHCDSSSMRAPTFFGLFLQALYPKDAVNKIVDNMTVNEGRDLKYAKYSCAKKYSDTSIELDPGVKELIEAWQKGGEDAAYKYYMK